MRAAPLVVELGSGSGAKTRRILEATGPVTYCPIDVSPAALAQCAAALADLAEVVPIEGSYLDGLRAAVARRPAGAQALVLFLGSTIGNFEPDSANEFLYGIRSELAGFNDAAQKVGGFNTGWFTYENQIETMRAAIDEAKKNPDAVADPGFNLNPNSPRS